MIIKALTIENFKGISEPVRIEFKPITLLFGANSAGKSTIIQAIHYLREILERSNFNADSTTAGGDFIDLGGFRNFVHKRKLDLPIRFRIEMDLSDTDLPEYVSWPGHDESDQLSSLVSGVTLRSYSWNQSSVVTTAWVGITVAWSNFFQRPQLIEYETGINGHLFARISASDDGRRVRISHINFKHPSFPATGFDAGTGPQSSIELLYDLVINEAVVKKGDELELGLEHLRSALPKWNNSLEFNETCIADPMIKTGEESNKKYVLEMQAMLSQLMVGPGELLRDALCNFRYIGPLRKIPPRGYVPMKSPVENRWADGMAAWDRLYAREQAFTNRVSSWLLGAKKLDSGYSLKMRTYRELDSDNSIAINLVSGSIIDDENASKAYSEIPDKSELQLIESRNGMPVALQDIGVGISQMIPVVVAALDDKAEFIMIEQPELHVHPRLQVNLGDLFISQIQDTPEANQFFLIETHSEHLLLRLLKRVRQTMEDELEPDFSPLTPEQLSIIYVEQTPIGLQVQYLEVNDEGDSKGEWPIDFFKERAEELF